MLKPLLYDFKRTLRSKSVIAVMVLPIAISLAIIPSAAPQPPSFNSNSNIQGLLYFDNNGYHILVYSANQYGQPISGVRTQFILSNSSHGYRTSGTTNSSGYSFMTFAGAKISNSYVLSGNITSADGTMTSGFGQVPLLKYRFGQPPQNLSSGQIIPLPISQPISTVVDPSNASRRDIQVFYSGVNGTRPNYGVYYKVYNITSIKFNSSSPLFNQSQTQPLGPLNDYHQIYTLSLPKNDTCSGIQQSSGNPVFCNLQVFLGLFSQNGTLVQMATLSPFELYPPPPPPIQPNSVGGPVLPDHLWRVHSTHCNCWILFLVWEGPGDWSA